MKIDTSLRANEAREEVREIKGFTPSPPVTEEEETLAQSSIVTLVRLQKALSLPATAETTKTTVQAIVAKLEEDKELKKILDANKITSSSAGQAILDALVSIRSNARTFQKFEELNKINRVITEVGAEVKN